MKVVFIDNGNNIGTFNFLKERLESDGHEASWIVWEEGAEEYFELIGHLMAISPHLVHAPATGHPLFVAQIACGIPTVVQAQDDLGVDRRAMFNGYARQEVTRAAIQSFSISSASAVVTTEPAFLQGMRLQNRGAVYIPEPYEFSCEDNAEQEGAVGFIGFGDSFEVPFEVVKLPSNPRAVDKRLCGIVIAPEYEMSRDHTEKLCAIGVPIVRASKREHNICDGFPFLEYSVEGDVSGAIVNAWEALKSLPKNEYDNICSRVMGVAVKRLPNEVYQKYLSVYEDVVSKAMIRTPVRGW